MPTSNVFGLKAQPSASAGTLLNARIAHDLTSTEDRAVTLSYGLLQTINYRVPDVNLQDSRGRLHPPPGSPAGQSGAGSLAGDRQASTPSPAIPPGVSIPEAAPGSEAAFRSGAPPGPGLSPQVGLLIDSLTRSHVGPGVTGRVEEASRPPFDALVNSLNLAQMARPLV